MYLPHTAKRLMNLGLGYPGSRQAVPRSVRTGRGGWGTGWSPRRIPGGWDYREPLESSFVFSSNPLILFILVRRQVPSAPQQRKPWRG